MMFSSKACRFVLFFLLSLLANAETVRSAQRKLDTKAEAKVELLTAGNYVILTKIGISTVLTSAITGDIAVSPIASTAIAGFDLILDSAVTGYSE
jgi:hypothetical protein